MSRLEGLALGMAWASRPWPGRFGSKNQGSTLWGLPMLRTIFT